METGVRLDKWLWAARFFKTRSLATKAIELGRVLQNEQRVKPAHTVKTGDVLLIQQEQMQWQITVLALSEVRGPAKVAQTLYQESAEDQAKRLAAQEMRRLQREPSANLQGRPTKRERRQLDDLRY